MTDIAAPSSLRSGQFHSSDPMLAYKFGKTLGKGSFATVKVATCLADGTKWGCKIIDKKALNAEDKEALQVEVNTMMAVDHNNIVRLKEVRTTHTIVCQYHADQPLPTSPTDQPYGRAPPTMRLLKGV